MKICPTIQSADAKEMRRQGELAFTMIEIALAIGVIGFALVAIIGILPTGMNVQKDNREDTVVSQDAPYFLEAIRNGASVVNGQLNLYSASVSGLDFLTNYVQSITFIYYSNSPSSSSTNTITFPNANNPNWTGAEIIGLLSTPQNNYNSPNFASNYFDVTATVRALSGSASLQQTANSQVNSLMAFTYNMTVMITPFNSFAPDTTNYAAYARGFPDYNIRNNRWLEAANSGTLPLIPITTPETGVTNYPNYPNPTDPPLHAASGALLYNLFEVRLRFSWPVLANGNVGPGRQTYRTIISSPLSMATANGVPGCWFFQPQQFTNVIPNGL